MPNSVNAHPHSSHNVSVVHNGIIENSTLLKKYLVSKGHVFKSQTDTEVIAHLVTEYLKKNSLKDTIIKVLKKLGFESLFYASWVYEIVLNSIAILGDIGIL